jgi:tRNA splicing ligase
MVHPPPYLGFSKGVSPDSNKVVNECRGLVLQVAEESGCQLFVRIVAKGFDRFDNVDKSMGEHNNSPFDFSHPFEATSKEDGTYILLFNFDGNCHFSTRHNFGEDTL